MDTSGLVFFGYAIFGIFAVLFTAGLGFLLTRQNKKLWHWLLSAAGALSLLACLGGLGGMLFLSGKLGADRIGSQQALSYRSLPDDIGRSLADHKGKIIVLNLWATWCGPCHAEMPGLDKIQRDFKDQGVVVLAISDEDPEIVMDYWSENDFSMQPGYVSLEETPLFNGLLGRPATFIIDREGTIRESMMGQGEYQGFAEAVKKLL